jgi:hypothetical protein
MVEAAGLRLPGDSSGGTEAPSNNQEAAAGPSGAPSNFMARQPVPLQNAAQVCVDGSPLQWAGQGCDCAISACMLWLYMTCNPLLTSHNCKGATQDFGTAISAVRATYCTPKSLGVAPLLPHANAVLQRALCHAVQLAQVGQCWSLHHPVESGMAGAAHDVLHCRNL